MTGTWPASWATGDLVVAAEFKKGIGAISDTTLGGTAANVDVTGIVATYAHLLVVIYARCDDAPAGASTPLNMRFNNDTAANYDSQRLQGSAAAVSAVEALAATSMRHGSIPGSNAGANLFGVTMIFIPHYAGSSNNKVSLSVSSYKVGTATTNMATLLSGGFWRSNAAITRITLLPSAGSFVAGTRVTIYGMGS